MLVLALVQGITEFLPISSSGHLVLVYQLFGITESTVFLSILFHVATLLSVLLVYRKTIWQLIRHPFCHTNWCLLWATIPTVMMALMFRNVIEASFDGGMLGLCFLFTAILISIASSKVRRAKPVSIAYESTNMPLDFFDSILLGMSQGVACFPGISRSGTTIATALCLGISQPVATEFSFLMSIPIIMGSLILEISQPIYLEYTISQFFFGFVVCFLVGVLAIGFMKKAAKRNWFGVFAKYLFLLSSVMIGYQIYCIFFR